MIARANILRQCIGQRDYQEGLGIDLERILPPVEERTAERVVDSLAWLLRVRLDHDERESCIAYLNHDRIETEDGKKFTVVDPFDGRDPVQIDKKVLGLLYVLGQHPSYHVR